MTAGDVTFRSTIKDEKYEIEIDPGASVKISLGKKRHGLLERE